MKTITLKNQTASGTAMTATFLPEQGLNLCSFKKGNIEIIAPSTQAQFEERFAGLGALIGPHFHRKKLPVTVAKEDLFPHIARVKAKGIMDPFSHGIARYAPWEVTATETKIAGVLEGKSLWNGISLSELEGQNFKMSYVAELTTVGLEIDISVVSDTDSLVGLHYYYDLPNEKGKIVSKVQREYMTNKKRCLLPEEFHCNSDQQLELHLDRSFDETFYPYPDPCQGTITLESDNYTLQTTFTSPSEECCWQLYHPEGASFVCIEPLSSQDPHHPNLSVSSLHVVLEILAV